MAWTDYSSTASNLWDAAIGSATSAAAFILPDAIGFLAVATTTSGTTINKLENSYNIPGFNGYQPDGTSDPISGDMGGKSKGKSDGGK